MTLTTTWTPTEIAPQAAGTTPDAAGLTAYLADSDRLAESLTHAKALVFRGFEVSEQTLPEVLDRLLPNRLAYVHGNSPRTKVGQNVYTSTEYPPEYTISMHNELSYAHRWPARLVFFCARQPLTGGATPIVDGATWLQSLKPETRADFAAGVRYTQNLHSGRGLGKSWQETFETEDQAAVEQFLVESEAEFSWQADGGLRVSQLRPSVVRHPVTGAEVWFNQSDQWHPASLGDETARELAEILPEDELPQSVRFADGRPIPAEQVIEIRDVGLAAAQDVAWRTGDLMVIDNVLVAHGRRSFTGPRRILVAMSN